MQRIKRNDNVVVLAGKERGKRGQVRDVLLGKKRAVVSGLNMVKQHQRQRSERTPAGIIEKEGSIHLSNLKLICSACQKPTRVSHRLRSDGVRVRVCHTCHQDID